MHRCARHPEVEANRLDALASVAAEASSISDRDANREALVARLPSWATPQQIETVRSIPNPSDLDRVDSQLDVKPCALPDSKRAFGLLKSRGWIRIKTARAREPDQDTYIHFDNLFLNPRGGAVRGAKDGEKDEVRLVRAVPCPFAVLWC